jgi:lactose/L-arabinose transport system permease protein
LVPQTARKRGTRSGFAAAAPYLFVAPFFVLFAGFILYPVLYSAALSFGQFSGGSISFTGLENYRRLFGDGLFLKSLLNTGLILVVQVPIMISLAAVIASVLDSDFLGRRRKAAFRLAFFLPVAVDLVTYSVVFSLIFSEQYGVVNQLLELVGLGAVEWRSDPFWARVLIVIALTWRWTGYNAVILLSGLQNIPKDLYDAASVDGAGSVTRFFSITVPLLRPVLLFCTVLGTIGTLQLFTEPFILTGGGPNNATLTSFYYIYDTGFARFDFGLAAAGTYVLATIVAVISYAQIRLARWGEV